MRISSSRILALYQKIQKTQKVLSAPGKAKEDVFILLAMIESIQPNTRSNKRSTEVESYNETKLTCLDGLDNLKFGVKKSVAFGKITESYQVTRYMLNLM